MLKNIFTKIENKIFNFSQDEKNIIEDYIKDEIIAHKNKKCCLDALRYGEMVTEETKPDFEKEIAHNIKKKLCCKKHSYIRIIIENFSYGQNKNRRR